MTTIVWVLCVDGTWMLRNSSPVSTSRTALKLLCTEHDVRLTLRVV